jgi:hypothetical protein
MPRLAVQSTSEPPEDVAPFAAQASPFLYKVVTPTSTVNVPLTGYDRVEVLVRVILSDLPLRLNQLQTWKLSQRRER